MSSKPFGDWLEKQRRSRKLKQSEIEKRARLAEGYVSKLERGKTGTPGDEIRARIHEIFDTSDDDLVELGILEKVAAPGHDPVYLPIRFSRSVIDRPDEHSNISVGEDLLRLGRQEDARLGAYGGYGKLVTRGLPIQGSVEEHRQAIAHILTMLTDREVMMLRLSLEVFADYHLRPDEPK